MLSQKPIGILCPQCNSKRIWRDGLRYSSHNDRPIQRFICRECGYRFSETTWNDSDDSKHSEYHQRVHRQILNRNSTILILCRVSDRKQSGAKNLVKVETRTEKRAAGATTTKPTEADIKGKIIEHSFWLLKEGYSESTIKMRAKILRRLTKLGANLLQSESVKETIAKQDWSRGTKANAVNAYTIFLLTMDMTWDPPKYERIEKLPFIPTEAEIDELIAACSKRVAIFLQLLKETGMRSGEAWNLKWTDIDIINKTVNVTPEKFGKPRVLPISNKLIAMLNDLPTRNSDRPFHGHLRSMRRNFHTQRLRITQKLKNPRIKRITFHTLRHWKATMEYHHTKDLLYIMKILGHRNIQTTLIYTHLVNFQSDEYTSKVASDVTEARKLIEAGFEYVTEMDGVKLFRKRK